MPKQRAVTDLHLVRALLGLHAVPNPRILDASYGRGGIWRGMPYKPTRLDARALADADIVGDWDELASLFAPASFDVVVWDPPHVSDGGSGIVGHGDWGDRYGTLTPGLKGRTIAPLFAPFLEAARAVLQPRTGVVLAKVADQVHCGDHQWQFIDLVLAGRAAGFTDASMPSSPTRRRQTRSGFSRVSLAITDFLGSAAQRLVLPGSWRRPAAYLCRRRRGFQGKALRCRHLQPHCCQRRRRRASSFLKMRCARGSELSSHADLWSSRCLPTSPSPPSKSVGGGKTDRPNYWRVEVSSTARPRWAGMFADSASAH
jgi:hypothetical protein